jgi:Coenzyme PQQ synthesis protein D (PqqD)
MPLERSPDVVYEVVDGKAVLVDPDGVELITLNPVGTVVWEELDGRRDAVELAADLIGRFDGVTLAQLEADVAAFLAEISAAGLVRTR